MDPITSSIVVILAKYALDKGGELSQEIGPRALETAKEMFGLVLERIGKKKPETAAEFPADPEAYQKPLAKALDAELQADAALAAQLQELLARYDQATQEHAAATGGDQITLHGHSAAATGHSASSTSGGVAVAGDVHGGVHTSGRRAGETEPEQK